MDRIELEAKLTIMGPFGVKVTTTMLSLAEAVEMALNVHDYEVIKGMREVTDQIFSAADAAMRSGQSNVQ